MFVKDVDITECCECGKPIKNYVFGLAETVMERRDYLIDAIRTMNNAIDNEAPDLALRQIRRVMETIDSWK